MANDDPVLAAMQAMQAAFTAAAEAIREIAAPDQAFQRATELREATDALVGQAADLRAQMVNRIWQAEEMSLAALAQRIGVSKSRADQFLRAAKNHPTKET